MSVAFVARLLKEPSAYVRARPLLRAGLADYGRPASATDTRAIAVTLERYYAVAARRDSRAACSMIASKAVRAIPIEYGRYGAHYLRGAATCEDVTSRMFAHRHRELVSPIAVNGVLVKGDVAHAVVASATMPDSMIGLEREDGVWTVDQPLGGTLVLE